MNVARRAKLGECAASVIKGSVSTRSIPALRVAVEGVQRERRVGFGKRDVMFVRRIATEKDMRAFGAALAETCPPGTVVLLRGPLGAGKTTLADGFIAALGGGHATSPTFTIAHRHDGGRMPMSHLDLFRLDGPAQVEELDLAQYLPPDGIALVEWPERAGETVWPADRIEISISLDGESRNATVETFGRCVGVLT
ncbi:MAG TPA: tRNA (adenosine(37)-N6)-threonylcarbamoyltransferase complex ATPase subunit type 1 TsaE [Candidatus Eremiobacteraceae bacterium]|nr:tRNA (adenosine(37)-N6)-threonylcarbamoyltransferase complex ATPase subunit type 1 TsaE [Candidatus Eremiobacteraceae bacterium]